VLRCRGALRLVGSGLALGFAAPAWADPAVEEVPAEDDDAVEERQRLDGRERESRGAGEGWRDFADGALWLPRELARYTLLGHALVARMANEAELVPRAHYRQRARRRPQLYVFSTLFAETERTLSVGTRMIAASGPVVTSARLGFGGVGDLVGAGELQYQPLVGSVPLAFTLEGLGESSTDMRYYGVGQVPEDDPRNHFVPNAPEVGFYEERRSMLLFGFGVRPVDELQLFSSFSLAWRRIEDDEDAGDEALSRVFEPGTVVVPGPDTWIAYSDTALRLDTREAIGPPSPGLLAEIYGGYGDAVQGGDFSFARAGGRVAGFIPIYRRSNILSPRVVLDSVVTLSDAPLPFTELTRQPVYRGSDRRRDNVSFVASIDYIWGFTPALAARVFVDGATVGEDVQSLAFDHLRVAGGIGLDLHSRRSHIAGLAIAGSADGVHVHVSVGTPDPWGNRHEGD
jgi:hypothetical protein